MKKKNYLNAHQFQLYLFSSFLFFAGYARAQVGFATSGTLTNINPNSITVQNVPIGSGNTSGSASGIAIGSGALAANSGSTNRENIAIGNNVLLSNTTGNLNTAVGTQAMQLNTIGSRNVAFGIKAIYSNVTGVENTAIGIAALGYHSNSSYNTAAGYGALGGSRVSGLVSSRYSNGNSAFGNGALGVIDSAIYNTALGGGALVQLLNGNRNVSIGYLSSPHLVTGENNIGLGVNALNNVTSGNGNVAIGNFATVISGQNDQLSIQNVIYGINMRGGVNGNLGVGLIPSSTVVGTLPSGVFAKLNVAGVDNGISTSSVPSLQLGYVPNYSGTLPVTNQGGITGKYLFVDAAGVVCQASLPTAGGGVAATCSTANFIPLFTGSGSNIGCSIIQQNVALANCTPGTHAGIGIGGAPIPTTTSGGTCYDLTLSVYGSAFASGGLWIASDKKFKTDIHDIQFAIEKIKKLRGVTYNFDTKKFPEYQFPNSKNIGFIAQELNEIIPEAVSYTEKGFYAVNYDAIIPVLSEGIKEQQTQIESQQVKIDNLELQITELRNKLNQLAPGDVKINVNSLEIVPNPVTGTSVVSYKLDNATAASFLIIVDLQGKLIKQISLPRNTKEGQVSVSKKDMANGMYVFSLVSGNAEIQSKKVLVTE